SWRKHAPLGVVRQPKTSFALTGSRHGLLRRKCPLMTQSGHGASLNGPRLNRYDAHEALGEAMRRREFITLVGGAAVSPLIARAQQPEKPVIGFLDGRLPVAIANRLRGFHRGLRDAGYVDGENVAVLYRYAENQNDRLPTLATELARRAV